MQVGETERLKFLMAFRPGLVSATLAAQMAAGDFLDKDVRYRRTGEFLQVVRALWRGEDVDLQGEHLAVGGAHLDRMPDPVPPLYFGGSSTEALRVTAEHVDLYLTWGEPPAQVAEKIATVRALAAELGRTVRFGIRLHVITCDTSAQAWAHAESLPAAIDPATIEEVQAGLARSESEGQRRMRALHGGSAANLEVSPNLWAGVGLVRGGAGTALVGSHSEVADRIAGYHALGIDEFVWGWPESCRCCSGAGCGSRPATRTSPPAPSRTVPFAAAR